MREVYDAMQQALRKDSDWLIELRRYLHQHPELCFEEHVTSKKIQEELSKMNISFTTGWGKKEDAEEGTGIVAEIGTGKSPCVALRADMDGLPVTEETGLDFASKHLGRMHACGHDLHMSILLAAARLLKARETRINGTIRLIFQPAEECGGGAAYMVKEGVLSKDPQVEAIFGLHANPLAPVGELMSRPGALLAASHTFEINVKGKGGHASTPYLTRDPVTAAATIVQNINTFIARGVSVTEHDYAGVISTPTSFNVIPPWAKLCGTIRALNDKQSEHLINKTKEISTSTAEMFGLSAEALIREMSIPVTYNDCELYDWSYDILETDAQKKINEINPVMGGEDFSYYTSQCPSFFFFLGTKSIKTPGMHSLHSAGVLFDEEAMFYGAPILALLALRRLLSNKC